MHICFHCGVDISLRDRRAKICFECSDKKQRVSNIITRAKRLGILPRLDGSILCVDCGKPACDYDHRDYGKPLEVHPVCRSCNLMRGHGYLPPTGVPKVDFSQPTNREAA
jgi:hypothetical protein